MQGRNEWTGTPVRWAWAAGLLISLLTAGAAWADLYGEPLREAEETSIEKILADPEAWDGKRVRVSGEVGQVCPMQGCWMEIEEAGGESRIRVKVEDGVIVFPESAIGRQAVAEGVVQLLPMKRDAYVRWLRHLAAEKGETFDDSAVGEGPFRLIQILGEGAEIAGDSTAEESATAATSAETR
ncbi:MAG: DUF4920 domain-containing protein [Acidobacteriota bacterium]